MPARPPAFTGLCVDVDRVRADNDARADAQRKAGLIIRSGREWQARMGCWACPCTTSA